MKQSDSNLNGEDEQNESANVFETYAPFLQDMVTE